MIDYVIVTNLSWAEDETDGLLTLSGIWTRTKFLTFAVFFSIFQYFQMFCLFNWNLILCIPWVFQYFVWFSLTFPVCSKFPDWKMSFHFPGFPVRVGTLLERNHNNGDNRYQFCRGSGVMLKRPHGFIDLQPIRFQCLSRSLFRPLWIRHKALFTPKETHRDCRLSLWRLQNESRTGSACHSYLHRYQTLCQILESPQWLLLVFCPKILGGGRDLWIDFLLENICSLSGVDKHRWWRHSNPTSW